VFINPDQFEDIFIVAARDDATGDVALEAFSGALEAVSV